MKGVLCSIVSAGVFLALAGTSYGQGGTTATLAGVVVDASGAVVPGADVVARQNATGVTTSAVSNTDGAFSFPALNTGAYTVTVSLQGFKTYVANNVVLTSGTGANIRATLEVGGLEEQVLVSSASEIVQTQNSTITTTINSNQITKLPLTSRSAMDFVTFMPGVSTPNGNRASSINGLPRGTINITLDGVNVQDNTLRSTDAFFAIVSPRLDAIEEVTVQTAAQGADAGGQGAVQVKFVTRSGGNNFTGSGYYYYRNDALNANTWFNNRNGVSKPKLLQNQEGFRLGGPVIHNKVFFFVNYEEFHSPSDTTRNRTILNTQAQQGLFSYTSNGVTRTVNLLQLAAANGQTATADPVTAKMLQDIRTATGTSGSIQTLDPNLDRYSFNVHVESMRRYPTGRIDVNLSDKHRFSSAFNYQYFSDFPDTLNNRDQSFPGFPIVAGQTSQRLGFSNWVRSTFTSNLVNEARIGYSGAPVSFFTEDNIGMYTGSVANSNGFNLGFPSVNTALTNPGATSSPQSRNATALLLEDTVTWLKGSHSLTMGASATQYTVWAKNSTLTPTVNFGLPVSDPAVAMFNATNFPGISAANLTAAQNLYALLTGHISSIASDARLDETTGQYTFEGTGMQRGRMRETDVYIQDQWRARSNLTLNLGLRYGLQFPFYPLNSLYSNATLADICGVSGVSGGGCNLFQPGVLSGSKPAFDQYAAGADAYRIDKNNFAPSVGVVWTPEHREGWLGRLMGPEGDFALRGGYARNYSRAGLNDFTGVYGANSGLTLTFNQAPASFALFRDPSSTGAPSFNATPVYPIIPGLTTSSNTFNPDIHVPSADSFTFGVQRALDRNTSIEVRYVGTLGHDIWQTINQNEFDIFNNGFVGEFRKAQANLQANIAAGKGATFAYTGAAGTSPLPIFLAYFNGQNGANAGNAALYTGTNWTNSTILSFLAVQNPNPFAFACLSAAGCSNNTRTNGFIGNATFRANAAAAGLPANFFIVNPDTLAGANVTNSLGTSKYNSLQFELRRRFAGGLQAQASYVFGKQYASNFFTLRAPEVELRTSADPGNALGGDITHTFKLNLVYDLPFGQGHKIGGGANGVVDRIVNGWQVGVASIFRSGELIDLGNVRLVGMTPDDVSKMFQLRFDNTGRQVYMLPQDVIDQTINAFSVSATSPTGYAGAVPSGRYFAPANGPDCIEQDTNARYGQCAGRSLVVTGPMFRQTDISFTKHTKILGRTDFSFGVNVLNAFNQANFVPVGQVGGNNAIGPTLANYQVTALAGTNTSRLIELVTRFNW